MGRKIPAKKHRGVKDPLEQQARRLQSLKNKIDAPPAAGDEQPVPRSLLWLFAPRPARGPDRGPRPARGPARADRAKGRPGAGANPVARLRAQAGESPREFSRRIAAATRALRDPAPLHYPEESEEEEDRVGARMSALRERRARKLRRAAARGAPPPAAAAGAADPPALSRTRKLALKKKAKKEKADERAAARLEVRRERVPFGDVAHAPPTLRAPRGLPAAAARPGRRALLLSALLAGGAERAASVPAPAAADAQRRERARLDAVSAYRALKAQRRATPLVPSSHAVYR